MKEYSVVYAKKPYGTAHLIVKAENKGAAKQMFFAQLPKDFIHFINVVRIS